MAQQNDNSETRSVLIQLQSSDGEVVKIDKSLLVTSSSFFREMFENVNFNPNAAASVLVKASVLKLVIRWMEDEKDLVVDPIDKQLEEESCIFISKHDFDFVRHLRTEELFDLAQAAQYLAVLSLSKLCQKKIALLLKDKSPEQINKIMKIQNDFTNFEENTVRKENEWFENQNTMKF